MYAIEPIWSLSRSHIHGRKRKLLIVAARHCGERIAQRLSLAIRNNGFGRTYQFIPSICAGDVKRKARLRNAAAMGILGATDWTSRPSRYLMLASCRLTADGGRKGVLSIACSPGSVKFLTF